MVKIVEKGFRDCTVTLDGSECAVEFPSNYRVFSAQNMSDSDIVMSVESGRTAEDDGVRIIEAGGCGMLAHMRSDINTVYVTGTGKVHISAGNEAVLPFKSAAKGGESINAEASGNPVQLDGLQGGVPFSEMVVSGKNLLTYPYNETTKAVNGITFTDNGDGSVTVKGTATARCAFWLKQSVDNFVLPKNTPIYISAAKEQIPNVTIDCGLINGTTWISSKAFPITGAVDAFDYENFDRLNFNITVDPGSTVDVTLYPQIELGTTPTAYEPPITGRELTVEVRGKNLLQKMADKTIGGLTYLPNDDGSVIVTGTQTAENYPNITSTNGILLKAGKYTLSGGSERLQITALDVDANTVIARSKLNPATFSIENDKYVRIYVYSSVSYNGQTFNDMIYPQLELGDTATPYEPYHGAEYTITPDSNPYTVPIDIRQQEGHNVISVSEGDLSVAGVRKNAAIKRIWDDMGMDLLFDGVTAADNPALIDIKGYSNIVVSVASKYSDDIINTGTIIMAVSDIIKSISVGIKRYFSTGSRASIINITGTINNCAIVFAPHNTGDTILNCKIYGVK